MKSDIPLTRDLVLIGGGHTHALVLKSWAMRPLAGARLTLINPAPAAPYSGMLPGFVAGHYTQDELYIDLVRLARAAGARLVISYATSIDREAGKISLREGPDIGYDICSIDIGITSGMPGLQGFAEHAVPAKPLDGFALEWEAFCQSDAPANVVIMGAGVAGAEIAMAAAHRLTSMGRQARVYLIDRSDALSRLGVRAKARVLAALHQLGITLIEHAQVAEVRDGSIILTDGREIPSQITLGAAGTRAYGWLGELGLSTTQGFIDVGPTLQSTDDPSIFAVGDCAHLTHAPRPKAGVFAVREAPVLAHNLRAALTGGPMRRYAPQSDYLKLISLGGKSALAEKSGITLSGGIMWRWKDHIDRKFMDQFDALTPMQADLPAERALGGPETQQIMCAGCGSKVGRTVLTGNLSAPAVLRADIVHLPGDDAALIKLGDAQQVISTDHLRAFTHDPVVMTRIAAVHALGDVWSMGAKPQAALVSLILPQMSIDLQARWLGEIMQTAHAVMGEAGAAIVGGHTTMGAEFTVGFTVTGTPQEHPITLAGAQPGDALIVTKPLGTGVVLAAEMQMKAKGADVAAALDSMSRPLSKDAESLRAAHAMTDVTGFGLAGHLANICAASNVGAILDATKVPVLPGALDLSAAGLRSSLYADNLSDTLAFMTEPKTARGRLMLDPQTAGGLLACIPSGAAEAALAELAAAGCTAAHIGEIVDRPLGIKLIE